MKKKDLKRKIREERRAEQARYDETTRLLKQALERYGSPTGDDQASYDIRTRHIEEAVERARQRADEAERRASS